MKRQIIITIFLLTIFVLAGKGQTKDLIFSHKFHIEDVEAQCQDCHAPVLQSHSPMDDMLPSMETCYSCHDENDTECTLCHENPDEATALERIKTYKAVFPHAAHVQEKVECLQCHRGIENKTAVDQGRHIPSREDCRTCHAAADYTENRQACYNCHVQSMHFKPVDHQLGWKKSHGIFKDFNPESCNHCHQQSYCTTCHEGDNLNREVHALNYRYTHGIDAKANKDNCLTCHQEQAFCIECHRTELVMPKNHSYVNWSNTTTGGRHAREAQNDFDNCMSCHNDAYTDVVCMSCHG